MLIPFQPLMDFVVACLSLNSLQFPRIVLVTGCLGLTAPVQVRSVFGGSCFLGGIKKRSSRISQRESASWSPLREHYFTTVFRDWL